MATDFNPYYVWLGIPPDELPANYYRLLSLRLFEANADVIDSAADRQSAHLRTFQAGKNGELTQRLLNEVAAARVCLLDPKKRAAYDQQLRAKLPAAAGNGPAAASGSGVHRPPPLPASGGLPAVAAPIPAARVPVAEAVPVPAESWDNVLGISAGSSSAKPGSKPANGANKRKAANRIVAYSIAGVVAAAVGFGIFAAFGGFSGPARGTLVFDLPTTDSTGATLTVDNTTIPRPADGPWKYTCAPGPHHVAGQRTAYKFATDVTVVAGQEQTIAPDWQPKATLSLSWPIATRAGAILKIDDQPHTVDQRMPLDIAVEPGQHAVQVTWPGSATIHRNLTIAPDGRESVAIARPIAEPPDAPTPTAPSTATATLVFEWPAAERKGAALMIDGHDKAIADSADANRFELAVEPGRHFVRIVRAGFKTYRESFLLAAGASQPVRPTWTAEQTAPPSAVVETTAPVEPTPLPVKKLPPPAAAEQERIAKQLDDLYKTSRAGPKDPAKARELYDVAAKDGGSPAERFVLLMKGAEIAAAAGDLNLSLQGIDALDADYQIDAVDLKHKLLDKFIVAAKPEQVEAAIPAAEQLIDQAMIADEYDTALLLVGAEARAATKAKITARKEIDDRLARRRRDINLCKPISAAAKKAQEVLDKTPSDPDANLIVGRWRCLYKNDWPVGLPLLAKGSDEKLKSFAAAELKAPTDTEDEAKVADGWWELAQKESGIPRDSLRLHAAVIYQSAIPNLSSALRKAAIEKRLAEVPNLPRPKIVASTPTPAGPPDPLTPAAEGSSERPAGRSKIFMAPWVDLLRQADPQRDAENGKWTRSGSDVTSVAAFGGRLKLNGAPSGSYDFEIDFTPTGSNGCVRTSFTVGSRMAEVLFGGPSSGLQSADASFTQSQINPAAQPSTAIEAGRRYHEVIRVRRLANNRASIDVMLDGTPYVPRWVVPIDRLTVEGPSVTYLTLGSDRDTTTFHAARTRTVTFKPVDPNSSAIPSRSTDAASVPINQWVHVLKLVDASRDVVRGTWTRQGDELTCDVSRHPLFKIPVQIDGSYDLEEEFTRSEGTDSVDTIIPVGSNSVSLKLGGWQGHVSGFSKIDGREPVAPGYSGPVNRSSPVVNGHRYQVLIRVRQIQPELASIDVFVDGKQFLQTWRGSPSALSTEDVLRLPEPKHAGFAANRSRTTVHSVRLKMLSGQASLDPAAAAAASAQPAAATAGRGRLVLADFADTSSLIISGDQAEYAQKPDGGGAIQVTTGDTAGWPKVVIAPKVGKWDLSGFDVVTVALQNPEDTPVSVKMDVNNPGANGQHDCSSNGGTIPAHGNTTLAVRFGRWYGENRPFDATNVVSVWVGLGKPGPSRSFLITRIEALPLRSPESRSPEPQGAKAGVPLTFTKWVYTSDETGKSGSFEKRGAEWVEVKAGKDWSHLVEVARTPEYVEIKDPSRGVFVRLTPTKASWSRDRSGWLLIAEGKPAD